MQVSWDRVQTLAVVSSEQDTRSLPACQWRLSGSIIPQELPCMMSVLFDSSAEVATMHFEFCAQPEAHDAEPR